MEKGTFINPLPRRTGVFENRFVVGDTLKPRSVVILSPDCLSSGFMVLLPFLKEGIQKFPLANPGSVSVSQGKVCLL